MLARFDAMMDGVSLAHLDPSIFLRDVEEMPAEEDVETAKRALHPGTRRTYRVRRKLSIVLTINVREYDPDKRSAVLDKITDWMGDGGWLVLSSRPNQRLYVYPDKPPAMGSALRWTDDLTLTLTAFERPYFEARWPVTAVITDKGTIIPTGTVPEAYVEVDAKNVGDGVLTDIQFACGKTTIHLTGLEVQPQEHVSITYTDRDLMVITAGGASALANRTAESSDDLIAHVRQGNDISVTADQAVSAVFRSRGRFR